MVKAVVGLVGACCQAGRGRCYWRGSVRGSMDGGGAVVRPLGACDSETLALGAFVIVVHHAAVRRLAGLGEQSLESRPGGGPWEGLAELPKGAARPLKPRFPSGHHSGRLAIVC